MEITKREIEKRKIDLEIMNRIATKSKLTQKDIEEISKSIKASATKKFIKLDS